MGGNMLRTSQIIILVIATCFSANANVFSLPPSEAKGFSTSDSEEQLQVIPISGGAVGPESLAFDGEGGGPYTGVSDGRIIKWLAEENMWIDFAVTTAEREGCEGPYDHAWTEQRCGRPLGLSFNEATGDLYIADAYMGLLKVGPNGGLATPLVKEAQGVPLVFTNALDIDPVTGIVYLTDSSSKYPRRDYMSIIITGDDSGRLIKFDPSTNKVTVLLDKLMFPNGVSLSESGQFLLVTETTNYRVLKYWLEPSKAGKVEVFAELPGMPDNIKRNPKGEFWVAINSNKEKFLKWIISCDWARKSLIRTPADNTNSSASDYFGSGWAVRLSVEGEILEILGDQTEIIWKSVSEIQERNGNLWIGSVVMPFVAKLSISS